MGVGSESASPLAAAVTWVLRDGAGMIGSLTFTYVAGSSFDAYLKEWRLFADLINDVGLTIDLLTPMVRTLTLVAQTCLFRKIANRYIANLKLHLYVYSKID